MQPTRTRVPPAGKYGTDSNPGIRGFLKAYQERFGTDRVVDLTLYGDYAIVNVPKPKSRQEQRGHRDASGFSGFGDVRATFPGARPVTTSQMAVPALVRNIARARARLNVEDPTQTYVIVRFIPPLGTGAEREHLRRQQVQRVGLPGDDDGRQGEEHPPVPAPVDAQQSLQTSACTPSPSTCSANTPATWAPSTRSASMRPGRFAHWLHTVSEPPAKDHVAQLVQRSGEVELRRPPPARVRRARQPPRSARATPWRRRRRRMLRR